MANSIVNVRPTRAARAVIGVAFRAAPVRACVVFGLRAVSSMTFALFAFWMKLLVDAALARNLSAALWDAAGMTASLTLSELAGIVGFLLRVGLEERTSVLIDEQLIEAAAGVEGIEHHERPEYVDQIELLRNERGNLSTAIGSIVETFGVFARLGSTVALLGTIHPVLIALPVFGIPSLWTGARAQAILLAAEEKLAEMRRAAKHLFDLTTTTQPAKEIRVFGLGEELVRRHADVYRAADRLARAARVRAAALQALGWTVFGLGYAAALGYVIDRGARAGFQGSITFGSVVLAFTLASQVNASVSGVVQLTAWMMRTLRTAARYVWLTTYAREQGAARLDAFPVPDRIVRGIDLEGVSFRYPGTDGEVLRDVSLHIPAGATVAVVGDNGAGKSTLVKLLCRFYRPDAGRIVLDGTDIARFDIEDWRAHLSAGFQDFSRFEFLARETVGVGSLPDIDREPAIAGALVRASATDVVDTLPRGLETQLGKSFDDGAELSGGQWQKLALGRAMMRQAPLLLVLDEPTASLDAQTEHALFERYAGAAREAARATGAITVFVSHRFSTVRMADLIVVVDGGRVAEFGSHAELIARNGLYAELYELQARAYR